MDAVSSAPVSVYGFSETVVWGTKCAFYATESLFGAPDNRIPKTGAEDTVSKNPYPESQVRKIVSRKPGSQTTGFEKGASWQDIEGFGGWFLRRSDIEYGFW